jgi:putative SOS response-associated peptidase YedK
MCGRFALYTPPAKIARYFRADLAEGADGADG